MSIVSFYCTRVDYKASYVVRLQGLKNARTHFLGQELFAVVHLGLWRVRLPYFVGLNAVI